MNELSYEFQLDLLKYIVRTRDIKPLVKDLDDSIFSTADLQFIFSVVKAYELKYLVTPKKNSLIQFLKKYLNENNKDVDPEALNTIELLIGQCYEPLESDNVFLFETIVDFAKRQMIRKLLINYSGKIQSLADEDYVSLISKIKRIAEIGQYNSDIIPGRYLFKDFSVDRPKGVEATPFFLKGVNALTAAGGFHTPQLIVFLAAPKGFKTGTILRAAVDFAIVQQKKVLYCDTENGIQSLTDRAYQAMVKCTFDELVDGQFDKRLETSSRLAMNYGGEIRFEYFPAGVSTLDDVEAKLAELAEDGFIPDIIIYDYFDKFGVSNRNIKDKRLKIQDIYDHAIRINNKHQTFAISVSQVKQSAVGRATVTMTDFAEDFGKAANCHAAFAICRTQYELDNGYAHIIPVAQRQGSRYRPGVNECFVRVEEERMLVEEIDIEVADSLRNILGITEGESHEEVTGPVLDD